jgi:hypothetical protein
VEAHSRSEESWLGFGVEVKKQDSLQVAQEHSFCQTCFTLIKLIICAHYYENDFKQQLLLLPPTLLFEFLASAEKNLCTLELFFSTTRSQFFIQHFRPKCSAKNSTFNL